MTYKTRFTPQEHLLHQGWTLYAPQQPEPAADQ
jgi:arginyl-tRNA--protein-N-Asp/Glu arginylyltransferase